MSTTYDQESIGKRLKEVRNARNLTLKEMNKISGIPISSIGEMETAVIKPNPKYLNFLASEFNVNLNWIFTGKGSMILPDFEIKWDFGPDSRRIIEMIYMLENCEAVRYAVLGHYVTFLDANRGKIEKYLPTRINEP